ncbi:breast carcinoma-amplified sequence 1 [Lampris incognitus]|uniref:breast carcinoma-amplified sequence 1 n=1 Tax=Lampris incognitus TaxID=2546036 RepID=UPI0024B56801|nr:breast carcinoma-amplified sequence 1 [Lampris incognitus]
MGQENSKLKDVAKNGKNHKKHENGEVNGLALNITSNGVETDVTNETAVHQNGELVSINPKAESNEPDFEIVEPDCSNADTQVIAESTDSTDKTEVKEIKVEKVKLFDKMFKKKPVPPMSEESSQEKENLGEDQMDTGSPANDPQPEPADIEQDSETFKGPKSLSLDPSPEGKKSHDTDKESNQLEERPEESYTEENPVMNFFKSLVTPTKSSKKETATPDAAREQSQRETQPTAATTAVAQIPDPPAAPKGMSIPPPPPPEPPKMEMKGDPAAKPVKTTPKEEPKAASKEPEASKGKSAKDTLSKLFRSKNVQEVPQPVVEVQATVEEVQLPEIKAEAVEEPEPVLEIQKVDASKTSTLEAAAKAEPPPAVQEEKKTPSKSTFLSLFKSKATEAKKVTPAPAAASEAAQTVKAKEEPKSCTKSPEAPVDNKSVSGASQGGDESANIPRKLEKRNSIHLFFKNLGQKRHSTDAGVQTEPVIIAPAPEKAK